MPDETVFIATDQGEAEPVVATVADDEGLLLTLHDGRELELEADDVRMLAALVSSDAPHEIRPARWLRPEHRDAA